MVDKICNYLTQKIRKEMPDITDERAEIINYGLQLVIGEIPKGMVILIISYLLGVFQFTLLALLFTLPYRMVSGGVHLKTHIGCFLATSFSYIGNAWISTKIVLLDAVKLALIVCIWIFSMFMIKLYAPADTEAVPILRKKERKIKKYLSYLFITLNLVLAIVIKNNVYSNLLIFGSLIQTITITRFIYKLTNNKYGYEEYMKNNEFNTAS